jgi:hypothetical protein
MEKRLELKVESELLDELRLISLQHGISMTHLVNLALKEFIISMDDDEGAYRLSGSSASQPLAAA